MRAAALWLTAALALPLLTACEIVPNRDQVMEKSGSDYDMVKTDRRTLMENERTHIRFAEGRCYGACPVYEMFITPDDRYYVYPKDNVHREYPYSGELKRGSFDRLTALASAPEYTGLKTRYKPDENCGLMATDMPTFTFEITSEDLSRTIDVYWGCSMASDDGVRNFFDAGKAILELDRTVYNKPVR